MNWSEYPYFRVACAFASGIFIFNYFEIDDKYAFVPFGIILTAYIFFEMNNIGGIKYPHIKSGIFLLIFPFLGASIYHLDVFQQKSKIILDSKNVPTRLIGVLQLKLKSQSKIKYLFTNEFVIDSMGTYKKIEAEMMISFDSLDVEAKQYKEGDRIIIVTKLKSLRSSTNPESFDYAKYLHTQGIFQQGFVKHKNHHLISSYGFSYIRNVAQSTKHFSEITFRKYIKNVTILGLVEALLLGNRLLITDEMYNDFANTGAIHVLSVSGFHVMIFISIFVLFFDRIKLTSLHWKILKILILLSIVWFYVILTGMSPSVVRSGLMVSMYLIGKNIFKSVNSYNILALSAVIMLMYNPNYLFQISFQFSYLSLLSILYFQPKIRSWISPESTLLKYIWDLVNVSLAAQILIIPLSIFYFHKFPVYFILSGIVAVPLVSLIIYLGALLVICEYIWMPINCIIAPILNFILQLLAALISFISKMPFNNIDNIWMNHVSLFLGLTSLIFAIIWLEHRNIFHFRLTMATLFFLILLNKANFIITKYQQMIFVYDVRDGMLIDFMNGHHLKTYKSKNITEENVNFVSRNNRIKHFCTTNLDTYDVNCNDIYANNVHIYLLNGQEAPTNNNSKKNIDILIISNAKDNDPEHVMLKFNPKTIVLHNNLPPWEVLKWQKFITSNGLVLHDIKEQGAYFSIIDTNK